MLPAATAVHTEEINGGAVSARMTIIALLGLFCFPELRLFCLFVSHFVTLLRVSGSH